MLPAVRGAELGTVQHRRTMAQPATSKALEEGQPVTACWPLHLASPCGNIQAHQPTPGVTLRHDCPRPCHH